jgi:spore germination protein
MLTINPNLDDVNRPLSHEDIDYKSISLIVDRLIILKGVFGVNKQPPSPVSNISIIRSFIDYLTDQIAPDILSIGKPLIGYDWSLPYTPGSNARSMSLTSTITLAYEQRALIKLDEESQTPYYNYTSSYVGPPQSHIVWFIDARSIVALDDVIIDYGLVGSGAWNITTSNQQVWSIINARFSIVKLQT